MLEVYTWEPNANSGKPLFTLKEKRVDFTYHYIDMGKRQQHSPEYLKMNPNGTVPALVHDGLVLTESTPMMEYIDEAFDGPPLRPSDPYLRWRMREMMRFLDVYACPSLAMVASNRIAPARFREMSEEERRRELDKIPNPDRRRTWEMLMFDKTPRNEIAESERRIEHTIDRFETMLAEYPYLAGDDFSLADINAMATFYGLPVQQPERVNPERTPRLWDWLRRCHARPGIQAAFAMGQGYVTARAAEARAKLGVAEEQAR